MIDVPLMRDLLRALPRAARLILVGDADQLPSVGPGDLLRSLVDSHVVPTARLTQILRQKEGSSIVQAAHAVLRGEVPRFQRGPGEGAFFTYVNDPDPNFLSGAPGGLSSTEADDADNVQYDGGTLDVSSASFIISQTQGNALATAKISARKPAELSERASTAIGIGRSITCQSTLSLMPGICGRP